MQRLPRLHPSFRNANLVGVPYRTWVMYSGSCVTQAHPSMDDKPKTASLELSTWLAGSLASQQVPFPRSCSLI